MWDLRLSVRDRVELVDPEGRRTWAPVTRETWSTPRDLRHSPSRPGLLVDPKCTRTSV